MWDVNVTKEEREGGREGGREGEKEGKKRRVRLMEGKRKEENMEVVKERKKRSWE